GNASYGTVSPANWQAGAGAPQGADKPEGLPRMRLSILVLAVLVTSACTRPFMAPQPGPWRFSGTVSRMAGSQLGRTIPGAELTVLSGPNVNTRVTTDATGRYVFES